MVFIGSGALLTLAVNYALNAGVKINAICVPIKDSSLPKLKNIDRLIVETNNPNVDLLPLLKSFKGSQVFSINNKFILSDSLLETSHNFFNIHNGLVQNYRGIAEVCIFAAICNGDSRYGVTLHKLEPRQKIDFGPVVSQIEFDLQFEDGFFEVMNRSLKLCQNIFENNLLNILDNKFDLSFVKHSDKAYSYKDIHKITKCANPLRLNKASDLGFYRIFFPKLDQLINAARLH